MKKAIFLLTISMMWFSCTKEDTKPKPKACFDYYPKSNLKNGDTIKFSNCSENTTQYFWNFGDGQTSTDKEPIHIYNSGGLYKIMYTAFVDNIIDTLSKSILIGKKISMDTISPTIYYPQDIFLPKFSELYNKWKLIRETGGWGDIPLEFDYITFKQNGIYWINAKDTIQEYGRVDVIQQDEILKISFNDFSKNSISLFNRFTKQVDLTHKDTLILISSGWDTPYYILIKQN